MPWPCHIPAEALTFCLWTTTTSMKLVSLLTILSLVITTDRAHQDGARRVRRWSGGPKCGLRSQLPRYCLDQHMYGTQVIRLSLIVRVK